ncbi:hypothetical protein BH24GEM1_BH24GEM1_00020 [soil metagenome]
MYRIEVAPGEEAVFRTIEELAVGIRNGVITPRARIYHHASQKWLPIGLHPHYKKALDMPVTGTAPAPVTSATPLPIPPALRSYPTAQPLARQPEPVRMPASTPAPDPSPAPNAYGAPGIPAPVHSPVVAMQNEVLRDLPVVSVPEPLPWTVPSARTTGRTLEALEPAISAPEAYAPAMQSPPASAATMRALARAPAAAEPAAHAPPEVFAPAVEHPASHVDELLPLPTARRSRRMGGGPVKLLGAAAALVICTHLVVTSTSPAIADPAAPPTARMDDARSSSDPTPHEADRPTDGIISSEAGASEAPRVTIAPARVPMTPGPAFAASAPARPGESSVAPAQASVAPAQASIAPAPAAIELALPDLAADSLARSAPTKDTLGMKKILRALNGPTSAEAPAAP